MDRLVGESDERCVLDPASEKTATVVMPMARAVR